MREAEVKKNSSLNNRGVFAKLLSSPSGCFSLLVITVFFLISCVMWLDLFGNDLHEIIYDEGYSPISQKHWFGTNFNGQDILARCLHSTESAFEIGFLVALSSLLLGGFAGAIAGYYRGTLTDKIVTWLYGCFDAIPFYLFIACVAYTLKDTEGGIYLAMIASFWTGPCKVIRVELLKFKTFEFVQAAKSLGASDRRILFFHIIPNILPLLLIEFTLCFVSAIKMETVLSFLGFGSGDNVSWGVMLAEASREVQAGYFNNLIAASSFMFIFILALNELMERLIEAWDPRKRTSF